MSVKQLFVAIFFVALLAMGTRPVRDPDMWWHLKTGEIITEEGLPTQDIFSFTVPDHEWITHEWLSEWVMWQVYTLGGWNGLILFFALMIVAGYWLLYQRTVGRPYLAIFILLLSAVSGAIVWDVRPQMFNLFLLSIFVYIIEGVREKKVARVWLYSLIPLTAVWANLHSGYLLGVFVLALYFVGALLDQWGSEWWGKISAHRLRRFVQLEKDSAYLRLLGIVTVGTFFAAALNPNGVTLWIYPFLTLGSGAMQQYIQEWHSPNLQLPHFQPFALMLLLGCVGWVYGHERLSWTDLLLFLGSGFMGLVSARNIPIFAILVVPMLSRHSLSLFQGTAVYHFLRVEKEETPPKMIRLVNWLLFFFVLIGALGWAGNQLLLNDEIVEALYPVKAVDYLQQEGIDQERIYNDYNWGGYLIWRGVPVFVDGRADVYGDSFLLYYRQTYDMKERWEEPLDQYRVNYLLMRADSPLWTILMETDVWVPIYEDETAAIWGRVDE